MAMDDFLPIGDLLYPSTRRISSSYSSRRREEPGVLAGFNYSKQIDVGDKNYKDKQSGRFKRASCDGGVEQETYTCQGIDNGTPPHMPSVSSFNFVAGIL